MEPIFDFSAAPHLPYSLRDHAQNSDRPDLALGSLTSVSQLGGSVIVLERNGELYIEFANAA
ncbi:MAG TPA: hypothetical protein PLD46_01100 [Hyphomicrobium sp.]|nr:hypothetical protein [Hyphomicrobium sp.]